MRLESFKNEFNPLFWDFIFYCNIHNLDYSIILPYLNKIEELNEIRYSEPNKEILQVTFSNKLYQRNENIMFDIKNKTGKINSNNNSSKALNIIKKFNLLVIKREISIQFGKFENAKNKRNNNLYIDHLNKEENLKIPRSNVLMKNEIKNIISNNFHKVETKVKKVNVNSNNKFPEISLENIKRGNNNDIMPIPKVNNKNININEIMVKLKQRDKNKNK